jgi:hypothetical protein
MNSLKQSILDNLDPSDLKYMMMSNYSTNKTEFYFNYEKWINDTFKNIELKKHMSIFSRSIKLKVSLPRMILSDSLRIYFTKFLEKKIKDYIIKKKLEKNLLVPILPKDILDKFRTANVKIGGRTPNIERVVTVYVKQGTVLKYN